MTSEAQDTSLDIRLDLPQGEGQQAFLDHFNAALRKVSSNHSASGGFRPDGTFETTATIALPIADQQVTLNWTVRKAPDGMLTSVDVTPVTAGVDEAVWKTPAQSLVSTALADALSDRRTRFFRRVGFHYVGPQLDGEYWLPGFRLAPAPAEDDAPLLMNAERVVYLDFHVDAIDEMHAHGVAQEIGRRHAARLSLLLDVGLFVPAAAKRWVVVQAPGPPPVTESKRHHLGFVDPRPQPSEMPAKGTECRLGAYAGTLRQLYHVAGKRLQCPEETRTVLRGVEKAASRIKDAFDRCARLWQVANVIGEQFPSAGLAYRIAAAEAITEGNPDYTGFGDFIERHTTASPGLKPVLDYLYGSVRSAHFHAGQFPLGEFAPVRFFDPLMDAHNIQVTSLHSAGYRIIRSAIVTWVLGVIPGAPPTPLDS